MATLVTVPVLMTTGAGSGGEEVAAVVVPDTITASQLEADVDIDDLFDAGAKLDDVPEPSVGEQRVAVGGQAIAASPQSLLPDAQAVRSGDAVVETPAASQGSVPSAPISETPSSAPSSTEAPRPVTTEAPTTTAAPITAAPTTAAPVTEAPTTDAPTTTAPTTTAAPEPIVEESQSAEAAEETAPAAPTPDQWAALRLCEASGNYSIVSSNGLYHGAYQFYQPTWDGLANQLGRPDLVGLAPSQAAPSDQDALALLLWQQRGNQPWPHCGVHLPAGP